MGIGENLLDAVMDHCSSMDGISGCDIVPERKVTFRKNPNTEIRNSKQIRIPNDKMTETNARGYIVFVIGAFSFLLLFRIERRASLRVDIRISSF